MLVVAWEAQESTEARFNPLATTHAMPGATDFNSVGVKNYRSVAQGLAAARETLEEGADSVRLSADPVVPARLQRRRGDGLVRQRLGLVPRLHQSGAYLRAAPDVAPDYATYANRPL